MYQSELLHKSTYRVKMEQFEGPLDLLLSLIEKRKLFINDISLAKVTGDYLEVVQNREEFSKADTSSFLLVASTLVLLKSRSLLPQMPLTEEEEDDIEDLEARLEAYRRIKELSVHVSECLGGANLHARRSVVDSEPLFLPDANTNLASIFMSVQEVLRSLPAEKEKEPEARVKSIIRLEDVMTRLESRVRTTLSMSFQEFARTEVKGAKPEIIVSFVALLELVKCGSVSALQDEVYGDIKIRPSEVGVPRYDDLW